MPPPSLPSRGNATLGLCLLCGIGIALTARTPVDAGLGLSVVILVGAAHQVFGSVAKSPVLIVALGVLGLGVFGNLFYDEVARAREGAGIRLLLTDATKADTTRLILVAVASFLIGSIVYALMRSTKNLNTTGSLEALELPLLAVLLILAVFVVSLSGLVAAYGLGDIWHRSVYLDTLLPGNPVYSITSVLVVAMIAPLGLIFAQNPSYRLLILLCIAAMSLVFLGMGTRRLALVPILFAVGVLAGRPSRRSYVGVMLAILASFMLLQVPLQMRALPNHGLVAYWPELWSILSSDYPWENIARNMLIGFALIGETAFHRPALPPSDGWIAVNPLPGRMVGWYAIAENHRLNIFTPMPALGELGNMGMRVTIAGCAAIGLLFAHLDHTAKVAWARGHQILSLLMIVVAALFLFSFTQYNLRSSIRILYYATIITIALQGWWALKEGSSRKRRQDVARGTVPVDGR